MAASCREEVGLTNTEMPVTCIYYYNNLYSALVLSQFVSIERLKSSKVNRHGQVPLFEDLPIETSHLHAVTAQQLSYCLGDAQLEQVKLSQVEAGRQAENDRDAREALWQKLQEANQKLSDASRDALGREAELEQRLGMAEYGQQMAEGQSSELHARLQQHGSMLQVRPQASRASERLCQRSQRHTSAGLHLLPGVLWIRVRT